MSDPVFRIPPAALTLAEIGRVTGVALSDAVDATRVFDAVAALDAAGPRAVALAADPGETAATRAGACFVAPDELHHLPPTTFALVTDQPARAFAKLVAHLYPDASQPRSAHAAHGISRAAFIHPEARLEDGVTVDPGVVVGPRAEIGSGTVLGAHSVIGAEVRIGRDCMIGGHVTIVHALLGNGVVIHPGARIGEGAVASQWPALGRVIIQDRAEIGANATVDRGSLGDTVLGEGCRIANLVHVAADSLVDRHARVGVAPGGWVQHAGAPGE